MPAMIKARPLRRNGFRRFTESRHADDPRAGGSKDNANTDWKANTHEEGQRGVGQAANVAGILCAVHL